MPTDQEVRSVDSPLSSAIQRNGGYIFWRKKLGLPQKIGSGENTKWTDERLRSDILKVVNYFSLDRMPTYTECLKYHQSKSLAHAIARNGGYKYWAKRLNLPIKESETSFGQKGEDIACEVLKSKGYCVENLSTIAPYDLIIDHNVRVDVKSSRLNDKDGKEFYHFNFNTSKLHKCDLYLCLGFDEEGEVLQHFYFIPSSFVGTSAEIYSKSSNKYGKYKNNLEFLDFYRNFYSELENI